MKTTDKKGKQNQNENQNENENTDQLHGKKAFLVNHLSLSKRLMFYLRNPLGNKIMPHFQLFLTTTRQHFETRVTKLNLSAVLKTTDKNEKQKIHNSPDTRFDFHFDFDFHFQNIIHFSNYPQDSPMQL
jgi:hypothetical protein